MPFGAFIRKKREEKGIQMNDFARQLEISPAYWSRIERDMEKPPKDELIRKAAEILGSTRTTPLSKPVACRRICVRMWATWCGCTAGKSRRKSECRF